MAAGGNAAAAASLSGCDPSSIVSICENCRSPRLLEPNCELVNMLGSDGGASPLLLLALAHVRDPLLLLVCLLCGSGESYLLSFILLRVSSSCSSFESTNGNGNGNGVGRDEPLSADLKETSGGGES